MKEKRRQKERGMRVKRDGRHKKKMGRRRGHTKVSEERERSNEERRKRIKDEEMEDRGRAETEGISRGLC